MKKLCILLTALLLILVTAFASADGYKMTKSIYFNPGQTSGTVTVTLPAQYKLNTSCIVSADKSIAVASRVYTTKGTTKTSANVQTASSSTSASTSASTSSSTSATTAASADQEKVSGNYVIEIKVKKAGKTRISAEYNYRKLNIYVNAYAYVNPVSSVLISGCADGRNLAGKTRSSLSAYTKLTKNASNGRIAVKAKSGWLVTAITMKGPSGTASKKNSSGASSMTLYAGKFDRTQSYTVTVKLKNSSTGGTQTLTYKLN